MRAFVAADIVPGTLELSARATTLFCGETRGELGSPTGACIPRFLDLAPCIVCEEHLIA